MLHFLQSFTQSLPTIGRTTAAAAAQDNHCAEEDEGKPQPTHYFG